MAKKRTPEHLAKARRELLPFHQDPPEKLLRDAYNKPQRLSANTALPPAAAHGWPRIDPLLDGLEAVISPERFAAINDKLQSIDALMIMVQNLRETSRADVLSTRSRSDGGRKGGRGHKKDDIFKQATDEDIEDALRTILGTGTRLKRETVAQDALMQLKDHGKNCGERRVRRVLSDLLKNNPLLASNFVRAQPTTIVRRT